jgi:hypothetical protein
VIDAQRASGTLSVVRSVYVPRHNMIFEYMHALYYVWTEYVWTVPGRASTLFDTIHADATLLYLGTVLP